MFDILLSDQGNQPLYIQLYTQIRNQIRSGGIANGTRLPSVRSLQLQLNISKTPIETAYQMLSAEGYVISKARSGLYAVNLHGAVSRWPQHEDGFKPHPGGMESFVQTTVPPPNPRPLIDFDPSATDKDLFPVRTWRKMGNDVLENYSRELCKYGDPQGEYALRVVIADYVRNSRGVVCSPEQIVIGSGISYSIGILTKLLAGIGHVAMEEPGFAAVREQFILNGFRLLPIRVRDYGISLDELEQSGAKAVYVTPSHQFPTGRVMPYAERERLLHWANITDAYIIEDDYDGEFRYFGKPIPSLQSLDTKGRVIYIGTFSKAFTPAIRMNYMVLPVELLKKLRSLPHLLSGPSRIEQWAMQAFMEQGHWYRHIRKMRNSYRRKHSRLMEGIQSHFPNLIKVTGHSAGLHIQLTVKTDQTAETLLHLAAAEGVRVYDFRQMWMNSNRKHTGYPEIYLGFGGISETDMDMGILLLKKAWCGVL